MNFSSRTRPVLAFCLGLFALGFLITLLLNGVGNSLFESKPVEPPVIVSTGTVKSGDTLASILSAEGLPDLFVYRIQNTLAETFNLRRMKPGHRYSVTTSTTGLFQRLDYHTSRVQTYSVLRSSHGIYSHIDKTVPTVWKDRIVRGTVKENAYKDLVEQGLNETFVANLIGDLADNIFAWRIDFFTEQRIGDEFEVLLEQEYPEGSTQPLNNIRILAAYYKGKGTRKEDNWAIRYKSPKGKRSDYFDLDGKAVRKAFLRAPFNHRSFRISSHFNPRRFHPILRRWRPHHGTDYACPPGTPVVSVGNGTVVSAGWNGGYGKAVDIRHSNKYTSRYGHLSRILVKKGQKVAQGQLIAKSGNTGKSTGPHLHFEMHVDGRQRNFLRLNFPAAKSVVAGNMEEFKLYRDDFMRRLRPEVQSSHASAKAPE